MAFWYAVRRRDTLYWFWNCVVTLSVMINHRSFQEWLWIDIIFVCVTCKFSNFAVRSPLSTGGPYFLLSIGFVFLTNRCILSYWNCFIRRNIVQCRKDVHCKWKAQDIIIPTIDPHGLLRFRSLSSVTHNRKNNDTSCLTRYTETSADEIIAQGKHVLWLTENVHVISSICLFDLNIQYCLSRR